MIINDAHISPGIQKTWLETVWVRTALDAASGSLLHRAQWVGWAGLSCVMWQGGCGLLDVENQREKKRSRSESCRFHCCGCSGWQMIGRTGYSVKSYWGRTAGTGCWAMTAGKSCSVTGAKKWSWESWAGSGCSDSSGCWDCWVKTGAKDYLKMPEETRTDLKDKIVWKLHYFLLICIIVFEC